jgi:hypothetical protein
MGPSTGNAHSQGSWCTGASSLAAASGWSSHSAQEPHPSHLDELRSSCAVSDLFGNVIAPSAPLSASPARCGLFGADSVKKIDRDAPTTTRGAPPQGHGHGSRCRLSAALVRAPAPVAPALARAPVPRRQASAPSATSLLNPIFALPRIRTPKSVTERYRASPLRARKVSDEKQWIAAEAWAASWDVRAPSSGRAAPQGVRPPAVLLASSRVHPRRPRARHQRRWRAAARQA